MIITNVYTIGKRRFSQSISKKIIQNNPISQNKIKLFFNKIVNTQTIISVDENNIKHPIAHYRISNNKLYFSFTTFGKSNWNRIGYILLAKNNIKIIKNYKKPIQSVINSSIPNPKKSQQTPNHKIQQQSNIKLSNIYNFFDRIFIINLKHRDDRWNKCLKQLKKNRITNYERFEAIKPDYNSIDKKLYSNLALKKAEQSYIVGSMGCKFSHLNIIKKAKKRNYNRILILEDDFLLCKNFRVELYKRLRNISKLNWDMFYLGSSRNSNIIKTMFPFINKTINSGVNTTHAYCVNKKIYNSLINGISVSTCEIDTYYRIFQRNHNVYICNPSIVTQGADYSDILHKRVSYRGLIG